MRIFGHLEREALADIAGQSYVIAGLLEDVVYQRCGGRLAVGTGDAYHFRVGIAAGEFYLADDVDAAGFCFLNDGRIVGYAGALHNLVGIEYLLLGVMSFLPCYVVALQQSLVLVLNG